MLLGNEECSIMKTLRKMNCFLGLLVHDDSVVVSLTLNQVIQVPDTSSIFYHVLVLFINYYEYN